jgi:hypothetical protein
VRSPCLDQPKNIGLTITSVSRIHRFGIKGLRSDDFVMLFAWSFFTLLCYSLNNLLNHGGKNNYLTPEQVAVLTPSDISEIVTDMKWVFAQEHFVLAVLWSAKAAMLIIYWRITLVLAHVIKVPHH